jgi:hypothetical protein
MLYKSHADLHSLDAAQRSTSLDLSALGLSFPSTSVEIQARHRASSARVSIRSTIYRRKERKNREKGARRNGRAERRVPRRK